MKGKFLYIFIGLAVVATGVVIVLSGGDKCDAKSNKCEAASQGAKPEAEAAKISRQVADGALLVDVREPEEFAASHAKGATNFPLGKIQQGQYPTQDKTAKIYVYCRSGKRAANALQILKAAGYTDVTSLGGLTDWQQMGGQLAKQ